jgi:hypothetical protein
MIKDTVPLAPEVLAARLLSRAIHDISGPTSGLTAALDILGDDASGAAHAEALALARDSLAQMAARIAFCRAAFGGAGGWDGESLVRLMETPFTGTRARLEWGPVVPGSPTRAVQGALIALQISAESLAAGGVARLSLQPFQEEWRARVDGEGPRARMAPETVEGLAGLAFSSGLAGRWAPARYLNALSVSVGGALDFGAGEGQFWIAFTCPG